MADRESSGAVRVLLHRNFGPYFAGNLLSNCGTWFQTLAQSILVFRLTRSTFWLGLVNFSQFIGVFLLAPWAGSAADRFDRRKLLIVTQGAAIVVTAGLAVLAAVGTITAPVVVGFALVLGLSTAFAIPALQALVPSLVSRRDLPAAVAMNSVTFTLARAVGPAAGAVVVARFGLATAFGLNAASYLALIAALLVVKPSAQPPAPTERPKLAETVRMVARDVRLLALFGAVAAAALSSDPVSTLAPAFATEVLHAKDTLTGALVAAFGFGAVVAAFVIAGRGTPTYARLALTLGTLVVAMAVFALARNVPVALVALFVAGFGFLASNTSTTTTLQLEVDESQRGRVMALWSVAFLGLRPFASLADGAAASAVGVRGAALLMTVPAALACTVMVTLALRERRSRRDA